MCSELAHGDSHSRNTAANTGAKAPPIVVPLPKRPAARARSVSGKICPKALMAQGNTPACAAPITPHNTSNERKSAANTHSKVANDHATHRMARPRRLPIRSASQPLGSCIRA